MKDQCSNFGVRAIRKVVHIPNGRRRWATGMRTAGKSRKREGVINTFFTELAERLRGMHIDPREAELSGAFWIGSDGSLQRNNGHCISVDRFVRSIDRIVDYRQVLTLLSQTKYE